ncbi:Predicted N-acetyltransferase YhbS [Enhydrobacter aerosaccus]|uniref:Predicted N-acetyltransferase YhbS n=1 Tax=Enhydrobacter aerosaccus TaxID=225324 RepID=A0A1T4LED7_9HYPH|nr:GNAT family N-acetyltransferase [Enhydrobacter aerosaccus]SJZ53033.1 Predicted N-acetyltransferase YhbS [Enhydrobacter aerosaccus]
MIVRDLQPADLPAVVGLLDQLGYALEGAEVEARLQQVRQAPGHRVRVAEREGKVVGLLHVFERPALEKPREAIVQSLVVDATVRGSGIGAALMRDAEGWARDRSLVSVALYTQIGREAAHAFYETIGYAKANTSHLMRRYLTERH